ncbi:MAG: Gfo/Idh/MocA family oxidoreductase [Spirochaetaceae bacterium]|jgi:myo-inositol 2-dehydrogenase/D-chiro-inositol 1-dehydrogenase/scyllo-inositol 2-dehydrogenase (NAD+)|nr:Gfo/Idh/MocA family oxidoreductase [Spirochaetaceae bacterium]
MKDTIGLCLIGAGRAGMIHGRNFASRVPHAKMAAISDTAEESARAAAGELGIDTWYTDYRRALENRAVDAVIVVTPTKFHHDIVIEAARAGKHILCEKPMAMNREECQGMIDAAQENKVKLQIGFMRRFDANFRRAKEIADSGEIGEVVSVKSLTRGPSTPQEWMYDIRKSNGPLAEVNSHDIDTLRWFTGSEAASLYAMAGNYRCKAVREQYPDFYDTVLMNVRMKNGMMGNIDGAQGVQYGYDARVDILGTNGSLHIGGLMGGTTLTYTKDHRMSADVIRSWTNLVYEAYVHEDIGFIGAIREDREPAVSGLDGMMAVDIVRAGNESIQKGQIIYLS